MPLARINTAYPGEALLLVEALRHLGFAVETVLPRDVRIAPADLEISLDRCPAEEAFARAQKLAEARDTEILVAPGFFTPATAPVMGADRSAETAPAPQTEPAARSQPAEGVGVFGSPPEADEAISALRHAGWQAGLSLGEIKQNFIRLAQQAGAMAASARLRWNAWKGAWKTGWERRRQVRGPHRARFWRDGVEVRGPHRARFWRDGVEVRERRRAAVAALERARRAAMATSAKTASPPIPSVPAYKREIVPTGSERVRMRTWAKAFAVAAAASLAVVLAWTAFVGRRPALPNFTAHHGSTLAPGAWAAPGGATVAPGKGVTLLPAPPRPMAALPPAPPKARPGNPASGSTARAGHHRPAKPSPTLRRRQARRHPGGEEVVVRHYPRPPAPVAQQSKDGVKRISDLD